MAVKGSHLIALAIAGGIAGWMLSGTFMQGGQGAGPTQSLAGAVASWLQEYAASDAAQAPAAEAPAATTIAEREAERDAGPFKVRVATVQPVERFSTLQIRGSTQADAKVEVKAETAGTLRERAVNKGDTVKPGDLLCTIDEGTRSSSLAQAEAALEQAEADYEANRELLDRGFTTKSRVRSLKTALDAARASLDAAKEEVGRTQVVAPVAGRIQDPIAEVGDVLRVGDTCVTIVDEDPMLFVGQVSEIDIPKISVGMETRTVLVNGTQVEGAITYISPSADAATRTFRVEVRLPNADGRLRDGATAQTFVPLAPVEAYKLNSSWLTLSDGGQVGVRTVEADGTVAFKPVEILAQTGDGLWVDGLAPGTRVIGLGQNFVDIGETVEAVPLDETARVTVVETVPQKAALRAPDKAPGSDASAAEVSR